MVASLFLSRVLGLVRVMVMAGIFGSNKFTDAYRLAFLVPDLLFYLIAGGALSSAFIPVFSEYLHTGREKEAWHIFSVVTTFMSILVVCFIAFAWVYAIPLTELVAYGKLHRHPELIPLIAQMSRIVLPAQFAFFIGGLMFGTLYARQVFSVPGLGPNVYNLGIIAGAIFLSNLFVPGIVGMSWGALVGAITGNLVIPFFAMRKLGADFRPSLDLRHPGVKKVFKLMLPVVLGLSLPAVYGSITQWFAAFYGDGVNTWMDYGNTLMQAPLGIFGQSLALAVFPALTQFYAQKQMGLYRLQLANTMRTVLYITVPISVIMFAMASPIVSAIYQHGAFGADDAKGVAHILQLFSFGISAWCLQPVLMRGYYAIHSSVQPIVIGTMTTVLFIVLAVTLKQTPLAFNSLPLSCSISAIVLAIALTLALRAKIGGLGVRSILKTLGQSMAASVLVLAICLLAVYSPLEHAGHHHKMWMVFFVLIVTSVALWAYYFVTKAMKMPEADYLARATNRMKKTRGVDIDAIAQ